MNPSVHNVPVDLPPPMLLALCVSFGSLAQWHDDFEALARSHDGEPGHLALVFNPDDGTLRHLWHADANCDAIGDDARTLLALNLPADVAKFVAVIDWPLAYQRYQDAVHAASEGQGALHGQLGDALLLDVRRAGVFQAASSMLPNAVWRDPAHVSAWAGELPSDREVLVYCVYGHEVGRVTALRLRALGVKARFLEGGIDAWQAAGLPTVAKGAAP